MRGRSGDAPSAGRVSVECTRRARPIAQPLAMTVGSIPTVVAPNGGAGQVESEQVDKPADAEERGGANSAQSSTWLSVLAGTSANPFVEEWRAFVTWTSEMPGSGVFRLVRDLDRPNRYTSFAPWESFEAQQTWKELPEFRERIGRVRAHCDEFEPSTHELVNEVSWAEARRGRRGPSPGRQGGVA